MQRIVNTQLFWAEAAFINWAQIHELHEYAPVEGFEPPEDWSYRQVALRWHVNAGERVVPVPFPIGLPIEPFTVWRRFPGPEHAIEQPLTLKPKGFVNGGRLVVFDRPAATVTLEVNSGSGGLVAGLGHEPNPWSFLTWQLVAGGNKIVRLRAGHINGVFVPGGMQVVSAEGSDPVEFIEADEWEPVEIVGYPVDGSWGGVGGHLQPHGLMTDLGDPVDAAIARIRRGTPPIAWLASVGNGAAAPPYFPPDPLGLVDEVGDALLPRLREALQLPQQQQAAHRFKHGMPAPESVDGKAVPGGASTAEIPTVGLLQMAVAGDPFLSLTLGYGTNLTDGDPGNIEHFTQGAVSDYMVTAPYGDRFGTDIELATLALTPQGTLPPPPATHLTSVPLASIPPADPDGVWRASTKSRWDRPLEIGLARTASHAVTRHDPGTTQAGFLLDERPSGGHHPIAPALADDDTTEYNFVVHTDRVLDIDNDPGHRTLHYAVANQNIFGVWAPWAPSTAVVIQPDLEPPRILAAHVTATAPSSGTACPAQLTVDVTWNWSDRRPSELRLTGTMFASPDRVTTIAIGAPAGLDRGLGVGGTAPRLEFVGDVPTLTGAAPGSTVIGLSPQGDEEVPFGQQQGETRRYRIHLVGLVADFASTDHIGVGLRIRGTERIAPNRTATAPSTTFAYASTPIAPAVPPNLVPLASLPDAEGRSHARITWPGVANLRYVIYVSDEVTMRDFYELGEPDLDLTLTERRDVLVARWAQEPSRRPFTRLTTVAVTGSSAQVTLPRGTTGIVTFVVVSLGAGGIEGPWPSAALGDDALEDALILRAVPRIAAPSVPEIEARRDGTNVHLTIRTRPGHRVGRVDVHRVRVDAAARELDSMGPPVAQVTAATPGWNVASAADGTLLEFTGVDQPGTSWRNVWYRAVAWADDQWPVDGDPVPYEIAERGLVPGRSAPSNVVSVAVPPTSPPDLSAITMAWPGGAAGDVRLDWTTSAPFTAPLGVHRTAIDVRASGEATPLVDHVGPLAGVSTTAPTSGDGLWRDDASTPAQFHAIVRRGDASIAFDAVVSVVDPLGRATQRTVRVPGGPILPPPHLGKVEVFRIVGRGVVVTFGSRSPTVWFDGDAYELTVSATPAFNRPIGPVLPDPTIVTPGRERPRIRPGRLVPPSLRRPEPEPIAVPIRPRPEIGDLVLPGRTIDVTVPLPEIPIDRNQPASNDRIQVRRSRTVGDVTPYSALIRATISRVELVLRSPDGRTATASREVT